MNVWKAQMQANILKGEIQKQIVKKQRSSPNLFIQPKQSWNPIPFHKPDGFDESKLTNICNVLADDSKSLEIKQRIGSDSQDALVFYAKIYDTECALKMLPITDDNSEAKLKNEMKICTKFSELTKIGKTKHFLRLKAFLCSVPLKTYIILENIGANHLVARAHSWYCVLKHIRSMSAIEQKRYKIIHRDVLHTCENEKIPMYSGIILSKLCWGDLLQFSKIYRDDEHLWKNIFCQVLMEFVNCRRIMLYTQIYT